MILSNVRGGHITQFENQGFFRVTPQQWRVWRGRFDSSIEFSVYEVVRKYRIRIPGGRMSYTRFVTHVTLLKLIYILYIYAKISYYVRGTSVEWNEFYS